VGAPFLADVVVLLVAAHWADLGIGAGTQPSPRMRKASVPASRVEVRPQTSTQISHSHIVPQFFSNVGALACK